MALTKDKLRELLAKARANAANAVNNMNDTKHDDINDINDTIHVNESIGMDGNIITYNDEQAEFIRRATTGESIVLVGAAGTGKSTCQRGATISLIQSNKAGILAEDGHKYLMPGTPGIVVCAYTRRAVNNIRKVLPDDMKNNCITIHKLLEYAPFKRETTDIISGENIVERGFEARRNIENPLSHTIHTLIFEEASMISTELYAEVMAACPHNPQIIFIGDIQQLPPVFGSAILGYKLQELPVIELTQVYRQALESPIIRLAHRILSGKSIPETEYSEWYTEDKLKIHPWKKRLSSDLALLTAAKFFTVAMDTGAYDPESDMILTPFNKAFGTDELNKFIAQHVSSKAGALVHEVIAGYEKRYYAIGDKVMYEKEDAIIVDIKVNGLYTGAKYQAASSNLDRWGNINTATASNSSGNPASSVAASKALPVEESDEDIDNLMDAMSFMEADDALKKREASHVITLRMIDSGDEATLTAAGAVNALILGYAITVHKAQGSEAKKVFLVLHGSHSVMVQRELLYTAVTRAKESLYIICEPDTFCKGIVSQRIKGNTVAEKSEYFKGKIAAKEQQIRKELSWVS